MKYDLTEYDPGDRFFGADRRGRRRLDVKDTDGKCMVYMVRCSDGTLYTGWSNHLPDRIKTHNEGKGAKYTSSRRPVRLVYAEELPDRKKAMSREASIKKLSRSEKEKLVGKEDL